MATSVLCRVQLRGIPCALRLCSKNSDNEFQLPEEPTTCCHSGCSNCVWIEYAQKLSKLLGDGGETARKKILENVKDPNLRSFLMLELKELEKKKD